MQTFTAAIGVLALVAAIVSGVPDVAQFRQLINTSRQQCSREQNKPNITRTCTPRTMKDLIASVPDGVATVRLYATPDFRKTLDLCQSRENGQSSDCAVIQRSRAKLGAGANGEQWTECDAQIKQEKVDCANARNLLCAFSQGTDFTCANAKQMQRTSKTIESGDQCFIFSAAADGRPTNVTAFNARLRDSKNDCRKDKDSIAATCTKERTMAALIQQLPPGINYKVYFPVGTPIGKTVDMCLKREQMGWTTLRSQVYRVHNAGPDAANKRRDCLDQLTKEQNNDCKTAASVMCAFTYGQDLSCVSTNQTVAVAPQGKCDAVINSVQAQSITRPG